MFLYSLDHLKANLKGFPLKDANGLILNTAFVGCLALLLVFLFQFWISWTFIETVKVLGVFVLPAVLIGNFAFLRIKH